MEIKESLKKKKSIKTIVLFGSVARGEAKKYSDIDLFIIVSKKSKNLENFITEILMQIEKKHKKNIQYIITGEKFDKINRQFLDTILREGIVICGKLPDIPIQKLDLEPYSLIKYDLSQLSHSDKMKLKRILFGKETKKKYKGKVYISKKKGCLKEYGGIKTGIASVMVPQKYSKMLADNLKKCGAKVRIISAWLQKI